MKKKIKIAIVGLGNCASALVQGLQYYKDQKCSEGLMRSSIGEYTSDDIDVVCGFDVDDRKVNTTLDKALTSKPNNTIMFIEKFESKAPTYKVLPMDGVCSITLNHEEGFLVSNTQDCIDSDDIKRILISNNVDIIINYLPVGSQKATEYWANICLETGISFLNCIPVFIASDPIWSRKFYDANIPIIGDDMKSQFGASILSQMFEELAESRGHKVKAHIQRNVGGNTDFLNMTDSERIKSKKISKENVLNGGINSKEDGGFRHAGPSEYIAHYRDNKVANFRLELEGFMGSPVILDARLSVIDSPNSAGVVIDAIRYLKLARDMGLRGSLEGPSAFTQKSPPKYLTISQAEEECNLFANQSITDNQ